MDGKASASTFHFTALDGIISNIHELKIILDTKYTESSSYPVGDPKYLATCPILNKPHKSVLENALKRNVNHKILVWKP